MRQWLVASAIVEGPEGLLLVRNRRRDGRTDWSPPGGVVEVADGESVRDGLTREVFEETGITVSEWEGPVWEVEARAPDMGWELRVEVHRAVTYSGELLVDDPDGIVEEARFFAVDMCAEPLAQTWPPTHEPLNAWLAERWTASRAFRYEVSGRSRDDLTFLRL
jgi:ADP-ribose pyrophosphatase YjhB (NUDIX family)